MKRLLHNIVLALTALCACACVYDFNTDLAGTQGIIVIEGDILIGDITKVKVSSSLPLSGEAETRPLSFRATVEASDGTKYNGYSTVDTRSADPSLEYRLVISTERGTYVSEWAPVLQSGAIDSLAYTISDDKSTMTVDVTSHGAEGNQYYRWSAEETWEYHAPYYASHYFVPAGGTSYDGEWHRRDTVVQYKDGFNNYYCWNTGQVKDVMIASTEQMSENRIIHHPLYSMGCYELRISYIYSVLLRQIALSETAYRYWDMMQKNSSDVGGLFSPEPYEMRGNITDVNNPDAMVLGYVSVAQPATMRYFINSYQTMFPKTRRSDYVEPIYVNKQDWRVMYRKGYDVYALHTDEGAGTGRETAEDYEFDWLPRRCVYCELWGTGTKTKPSWWPNDHR